MNQNAYYIGMDGGATKCETWVEFEDQIPPVHITGGPINICSNSLAAVAQNLSSIFEQVQQQCGDLAFCRGICIGVAGFSNPATEPFFKRQATIHAPHAAIVITSDAHVALYGALLADEGIILVSGTGSVCYGAKKNRIHRAGGYGHLLDDEGSGYAIGRDILLAVLKAWDGRGKSTILTELIKDKHAFENASDIIAFVYDDATGKKGMAAFAPLLTAGCLADDEICLAIADQAAQSLMELVTAVVSTLELDHSRLALSGSILTKEPFVKASLLQSLSRLYPNLQICQPQGTMAEGAALLAKSAARRID